VGALNPDQRSECNPSFRVYDHVPYVAMRMVPAVLGVATVPISYITLRALDCRATTALMASLFITFENALATQSRFILLDSPLVFFTALTVLLWTGFCNEDKHKPFTTTWWTWLTLSGLSLGAVVSCKWVGLFTIATVGLSTIKQLWLLLGDLRVSPPNAPFHGEGVVLDPDPGVVLHDDVPDSLFDIGEFG
jgi:dolichyl-phosphate-mannose-protein mannosyltransferase